MNEDKRAEALRLAKEAGFDVPDTAESWPKMEHLIALARATAAPQAPSQEPVAQEPTLGQLMREQRDSRIGVYPDGNPNAGVAMAQRGLSYGDNVALWIQSDHLDKLNEPTLCRCAKYQFHPDFIPLYAAPQPTAQAAKIERLRREVEQIGLERHHPAMCEMAIQDWKERAEKAEAALKESQK